MKVNHYNLLNEANVKFEIAHHIKLAGIELSLEYRISKPNNGSDIFDIVIIRNDLVVGIIECKKRPRKRQGKSGQIKRYERYGVPVFFADGPDKIEAAVEFAKQQMSRELTDADRRDYGKNRQEAKFYADYMFKEIDYNHCGPVNF